MFILENAGTILVGTALLLLVAVIIRQLAKDKKKGKSACGNSCSCCPMSGSCHKA